MSKEELNELIFRYKLKIIRECALRDYVKNRWNEAYNNDRYVNDGVGNKILMRWVWRCYRVWLLEKEFKKKLNELKNSLPSD